MTRFCAALSWCVRDLLSPSLLPRCFRRSRSLVFLAHNVSIVENLMLIANAEISGSVTVGRGVWGGPAATVINGVEISDRSFIGMGAVVTPKRCRGNEGCQESRKSAREKRATGLLALMILV